MTTHDEITELKHRLAAAETLLAQRASLDAALRESEARHRLLIGTWAQAVWETDAAGVVTADSPSWRAYTGQTLDEWLGYGWLDAIHPDDRDHAERQWREATAACRVVDTEYRLRAYEGGWRWTNIRAAPVMGVGGRVEKWVGLNLDIDARKRAEDALRESEAKYRLLFETMDQGYSLNEVVRDAEGRAIDLLYLEHNQALERLTGVPASEAVGRLASEVFPGLDRFWIDIVDRVVTSGASEQVEHELSPTGRWYQAKFYPAGGDRCTSLFDDITDRKRAEAALRESEGRQAFLLELGDAMREQTSAEGVVETAARLLGLKLNASRVVFGEFDDARDLIHIRFGWTADGAQAHPATLRQSSFLGPLLDELRAGLTVRFEDVGEPPYVRPDLEALAAIGVKAAMSVPLIIGGRLVLNLVVHNHSPYRWTDAELDLAKETAARTWAALQRARAEAALHASEARFRQFAEASAFGLWIREARTLVMEYVSPAVPAIYGVDAEAFHGDLKLWAALIVPDDREVTLQHIERARQGEPVVHEFRIQRQTDQAFRWIRNTDFPLLDRQGNVERIGGIVEDVTEAKLAVEHQAVLLAELQHRVRNIMAMIRSIARRSADSAASVDEYRSLLEGRLLALARVQVLLTREANAGGWLRAILDDEIEAQAHHGDQFELIGPNVRLSPKAVEVLTLAFHELTTNALKHGALSVPDGRLRVDWAPFEKRGRTWLALDWREEGAPSRGKVTRRGFGSDLIEGRISYELAGVGRIVIEPGGAHCHLEFPLKDGESILETDAPVASTVFGGTLDMAGAPDLTGRVVLVVEDDYYIAGDTAAALRGAGATVLGPCPSEDATLDLLQTEVPTHAVLDLNLGGGGPRFEIAHALRARGVPFVFLTGYDPGAIPADLASIPRLQKPIPFRTIVEAVAQLDP